MLRVPKTRLLVHEPHGARTQAGESPLVGGKKKVGTPLERNFSLLVEKLKKLFEGSYFPSQVPTRHETEEQVEEEHAIERDKSIHPGPTTQHIRSAAGRIQKLRIGQLRLHDVGHVGRERRGTGNRC